MNRTRRKALISIKTSLNELREAVEQLLSDEQSYYEAMPEPFQNGQRGEEADANIEQMGAIIDAMEDAALEFDVLLRC
jgi:hypothetical protein